MSLEYQILDSPHPRDLERQVREAMASGWYPLGGVAIGYVFALDQRCPAGLGVEKKQQFFQAMERGHSPRSQHDLP